MLGAQRYDTYHFRSKLQKIRIFSGNYFIFDIFFFFFIFYTNWEIKN